MKAFKWKLKFVDRNVFKGISDLKARLDYIFNIHTYRRRNRNSSINSDWNFPVRKVIGFAYGSNKVLCKLHFSIFLSTEYSTLWWDSKWPLRIHEVSQGGKIMISLVWKHGTNGCFYNSVLFLLQRNWININVIYFCPSKTCSILLLSL